MFQLEECDCFACSWSTGVSFDHDQPPVAVSLGNRNKLLPMPTPLNYLHRAQRLPADHAEVLEAESANGRLAATGGVGASRAAGTGGVEPDASARAASGTHSRVASGMVARIVVLSFFR